MYSVGELGEPVKEKPSRPVTMYGTIVQMFFRFSDRAFARSVKAMRRDARLVIPGIAMTNGSEVGPQIAGGGPSRARGVPQRLARLVLRAIVWFHVWYLGVTCLLVLCFGSMTPAATTLSLYRKYVDGWKITRPIPVSLIKIPKTTRQMLVSVEDYRFYEHHGIDLEAFQRAIEVNRQLGRPLYGGSTLTMQTARTLFLIPTKSYVRKYLEVIVAFELELFVGKKRILELYFSWAEWGRGVFGIEAASRRYYGVSTSKLDIDQTARLMAILSSPIRYSPTTILRSSLLRTRYNFLMERYTR